MSCTQYAASQEFTTHCAPQRLTKAGELILLRQGMWLMQCLGCRLVVWITISVKNWGNSMYS